MDVMMPEKNGLEALSEIKAARPETEIVMITGNADAATVQGADYTLPATLPAGGHRYRVAKLIQGLLVHHSSPSTA